MTGTGFTAAKKVVGFHVEGASPSPTAPSMMQAMMTAGSSPTPVIIPPTFQRESSAGPRSAAAAEAARAADTLPAAASGQAVPAPPAQLAVPEGLSKVPSLTSIASGTSMSSTSAGVFSLDHSTRQTPPPQPSAFAAQASTSQGSSHAGCAPGHHHHHHHHHHHAAPSGQQPAAAPQAPAAAQADPKGPKPQREMSKAERRALQESQRAAKAAQKDGGGGGSVAAERPKGPAAAVRAEHSEGGRGSRGGSVTQEVRPSSSKPTSVAGTARSEAERRVEGAGGAGAGAAHAPAGAAADAAAAAPKKKKDPKAVSLNSTELFAHLQQYKRVTVSSLLQQPAVAGIHPAVLQLGLRYADGSIRGANARCLAMLNAFCQVVRDYTTPEGKELSRDLLRHLGEQVNFLVVCRPLSVGMGNALRNLKLRVACIPADMPEAEAKELLEQELADYVSIRIDNADKQLVAYAVAKVEAHGDVILTYAASHVVARALIEAARAGKCFRVVVMDSRPELEGRATLATLLAAGIPCTYVHLNAASYIIRDVTKVFLGAAAVLSNGTVLSRAGTAAVAMMAHAHSKPVMICCETHKFNERVQLDSITHNELGDPQALAALPGKHEAQALEGWSEHPRLRLLNLKYDVMPAEYVTMVVTEFGMVPPTSVPVILREFRQNEQTVSGLF